MSRHPPRMIAGRMTGPTPAQRRPEPRRVGKWCAFGGISLSFFFLNAATFTSLGVVLFTMGADLHWSMTSAGLSFTVLGLACGLSSPLAAVVMVRIGGRGSLCIGASLLTAGFLIASVCQSLWLFFAAMVCLGVGFTLSANVPGVYLLAGWFGRGSSRIIGYYFMLGAFGAAFGPPVVSAIVQGAGWRAHWQLMAAVAAAIGSVCFVLVRDPTSVRGAPIAAGPGTAATGSWTPRQAMLTPQFILVCASQIMTMACVTTNSSALVAHLVRMGASQTAAAFVLSAGATTATLVKGGSGRLCEIVSPSLLLAGGLVLQAVGCAMLAIAHTPALQYGSALAFGTGWGLGIVACTIVPLRYFGDETGARILAVAALLTTVAAAGPVAAGLIADRTGSYAPIYNIYAGLLLMLAIPVTLMRAPRASLGMSTVPG